MSRPSSQRQYTRIASTLGSLVTVLLLQACGGGGVERAPSPPAACIISSYAYQAPDCQKTYAGGCVYSSDTVNTAASLTGDNVISDGDFLNNVELENDRIASIAVNDSDLFFSQHITNTIKRLTKTGSSFLGRIFDGTNLNPGNQPKPYATTYVHCKGLYYTTQLSGTLNLWNSSTNSTEGVRSFTLPEAVTSDPAGNVYVIDRGSPGTLTKIDPLGNATTILTDSTLRTVTNIAYAPSLGSIEPRIYMTFNNVVKYINISVQEPSPIIRPLNTNAGLPIVAKPVSIAADGAGYLYMLHGQDYARVGDDVNQGHGVSMFDPWIRTERRIAGVAPERTGTAPNFEYKSNSGTTDDQDALKAKFLFPSALTVDRTGNVYILDAGNRAIRKLTPRTAD